MTLPVCKLVCEDYIDRYCVGASEALPCLTAAACQCLPIARAAVFLMPTPSCYQWQGQNKSAQCVCAS